MNDIKKHRFVKTINFGNLLIKKISAPYKPTVKGESDVSNFGIFEDSLKDTVEIPNNVDPFLEEF